MPTELNIRRQLEWHPDRSAAELSGSKSRIVRSDGRRSAMTRRHCRTDTVSKILRLPRSPLDLAILDCNFAADRYQQTRYGDFDFIRHRVFVGEHSRSYNNANHQSVGVTNWDSAVSTAMPHPNSMPSSAKSSAACSSADC